MINTQYPSLSILIPAYRVDITLLVTDLKNQAEKLQLDWEMIVYDDASGPPWDAHYRSLSADHYITLTAMTENKGRAAARQKLAGMATKKALLFLDCDARVVDPDYLKKMLESFDGASVVTGRTLVPDKPEGKQFRLRWKYGRKRESLPAQKRKKYPYRNFSTFHFLMPASLTGTIGFRTELSRYGHEDTLLGLDLQKAGVPVKHTDIPLEHAGIDDAQTFLEKTGQALETLAGLVRNDTVPESGLENIRLVRVYRKYRFLFEKKWITIPYFVLLPLFYRLLTSSIPSLILFDLYRLGKFVSFLKEADRP